MLNRYRYMIEIPFPNFVGEDFCTCDVRFTKCGKEYVVFYAGGNALAASAHGDNLWLFSLDGTLGPVKAAGAGGGVGHAGEAPAKPASGSKGSAAAGKAVFADNCSGCHGQTGHGGNGGPDLTAIPSAKNLEHVTAQVTNGGGGMPAFKGTLSDKEIRDVAAFVTQQSGTYTARSHLRTRHDAEIAPEKHPVLRENIARRSRCQGDRGLPS